VVSVSSIVEIGGIAMNNIILTILDKVVLATIVGIVSSAVFLLVLSRMRPKLEISPKIARTDGKFRVKVVNRTRSSN